jgi:ER lumen protein retaining receptor
MNRFQFIGDVMHLLSIVILLLQIDVTKSCAGISLKTQVLYFVVFATRYAHMFTKWVSLYTFVMKLFFLGTSAFIIYQMYFVYKDTYDHTQDNFKAEFLLLGSALCSIATNFESNINWLDIDEVLFFIQINYYEVISFIRVY